MHIIAVIEAAIMSLLMVDTQKEGVVTLDWEGKVVKPKKEPTKPAVVPKPGPGAEPIYIGFSKK